MKILTKEEEQAHYNATLKGGITGGLVGLGVGAAVVYGAHTRFHTFRQLTIQMKAFLVTSSGTFASIISADRASRSYEDARDPSRQYRDKTSQDMEAMKAQESSWKRLKDWGRENRYPIVTASWVASMAIALGLVGRNPYLSTTQKLVQARVYAQGLTLAVLMATAAFEVNDANSGKGRWETVKVLDPNDPDHKHMIEKKIHHEAYAGEDLWRDMVASEERKMAERKKGVQKQVKEDEKSSSSHKSSDKSSEKSSDASSDKSSDKPAEKSTDKSSSKPSDSSPGNNNNNKVKKDEGHPRAGTQGPRQGEGRNDNVEKTDKLRNAKNKILTESKSAGKVDYDEAMKIEKKNMEAQNKKEDDSKLHAMNDTAKVKDRGEYNGRD